MLERNEQLVFDVAPTECEQSSFWSIANSLEQEGYFQADSDMDGRARLLREVVQRRGQPKFREALCKRYRNRCVITGCDVLDVLEAAHIKPYRDDLDNDPANGLLLRADIHTLFDLYLLAINPKDLCVELHPAVAKGNDYKWLGKKQLHFTRKSQPSKEALELRFRQFQRKMPANS